MFEPDAESMPAEQRAEGQQERLRTLVDRLLGADGVQGQRLKAAGITGGRDVTLGDLPSLPMTVKEDMWNAYPFGMLTVEREKVVAFHGSSGTGGKPTLVAYTRADLSLWARMCARALAAAGGTSRSTVHNAYGYGLFTGGLGFHQGAIEAGAAGSLSAGLFGAEPWSAQLRGRIEELLGLRALDVYGLSEVIGPGVAAECIEAADGLHVNEDHFLVEAIDPATGAPVPDGTRGELTFTTLTKEALPLLRYRTGDIAALRPGSCPCGRTLVKMSKITGRKDDMLVIRGVNVYPSEIERVLLS